MTIKSSGAISINDIVTEFNGTAPHGLNEYYRAGGLVPNVTTNNSIPTSGEISFNNFYNTTAIPASQTLAITSNQREINLRTWALSNGWNGVSYAEITVNSDVYVWSDNISVAAITVNGSWPNGLTLINNGYIIGKGGNGGGSNVSGYSLVQATSGGPAISLGIDFNLVNSGYIAGGGGGGGTCYLPSDTVGRAGGGGGAGGGQGGGGWYRKPDGTLGNGTIVWLIEGGAGGAPGSAGTELSDTTTAAGGGGGRVLPGTGGAAKTISQASPSPVTILRSGTAGGSGGGGGSLFSHGMYTGGSIVSGAGGDRNNPGIAPTSGTVGAYGTLASYGSGYVLAGGGGGGWGASGAAGNGTSTAYPDYSVTIGQGGSGGKAISLNGFVLTRSGLGTYFGSVS